MMAGLRWLDLFSVVYSFSLDYSQDIPSMLG